MSDLKKIFILSSVNGSTKAGYINGNTVYTRYSYDWCSNGKVMRFKEIIESFEYADERMILPAGLADFEDISKTTRARLIKALIKKHNKLCAEEQKAKIKSNLEDLTKIIDQLPECLQEIVLSLNKNRNVIKLNVKNK